MREPNERVENSDVALPLKRRRLLVEGGLIVLFWMVMAVLLIGQRSVSEGGRFAEVLVTQVILQALTYYLFWALLTPLVFWLTNRFGFDREDWYRWILLHVAVAVLGAIVGELFQQFTYELYGFWPNRRGGGIDPARAIFDLWWLNELFLYLAILAAGFARGYFRMYQARREEAALLQAQTIALQAQLAQARLTSLRMQLNPHFLFNTLNAVSSLVDRDPRGVRRMVARLSELLRHTLDGDAGQEVTLEEEIHFLDRYLEIEQMRFQDRLEIDQDIPPDVHGALVPNMILQPLVENAVKHGATRVEGVGRIDISAWREGNQLLLAVQDNGPGFPDTEPDTTPGVGLENTRARLEALYGAKASLEVRGFEEGGVIAIVRLPFRLMQTGEKSA